MGLLSLTYRRPAHVDASSSRASLGSDNASSLKSSRSGTSAGTSAGIPAGIPAALSFDRIIAGGTCPPCTVRDFMNYLIYVERAAENLQFFLWYRDYTKRFGEASTSDMVLAREWTQEMEDEAITRLKKDQRREPKNAYAAELFKGTDFEKQAQMSISNMPDPFSSPPATRNNSHGTMSFETAAASQMSSYKTAAGEAYAAVGAKAPFTIQPFRDEIDRIVATYLREDAPRELNLSDQERRVVLQALAFTTHPSAFRTVAAAIETSLRRQSHPNFIRWSICNGNSARVWFARGLGIFLIVAGIIAAVLLTLSSAGRGYRALAAISWVIGVATLIAGIKGMCVVLHGMHHHHVRPWELFISDEEEQAREKTSFESFGSANSYEEEPWLIRYERRNIVRKIFDREVWIREPALRQIQDTIFLQSILAAVAAAGFTTAIFILIPAGRFF